MTTLLASIINEFEIFKMTPLDGEDDNTFSFQGTTDGAEGESFGDEDSEFEDSEFDNEDEGDSVAACVARCQENPTCGGEDEGDSMDTDFDSEFEGTDFADAGFEDSDFEGVEFNAPERPELEAGPSTTQKPRAKSKPKDEFKFF